MSLEINPERAIVKKPAHPFELKIQEYLCTVGSHSRVQAMPAFQNGSALYMVLMQRVGHFPIISTMTLSCEYMVSI